MSSFIPTGDRDFAPLQAKVACFTHQVTGARHLHFATEDSEFAFLIGFPTLPGNSDGRAHVLEHLLLCGSQRFPVRDPFFAMMRRSLATFMNAMTYADMTVYPCATVDRADFFNLLDVYLDATFFPRLTALDFLQEGWRAELHDDHVSLHGVVLNEMKSKMSDPGRALYLGLNRALLPDSPYAVDSGGDPLEIPQLSHQNLVDFHRRHYHPSQAVFMSWGRLEPADVQARIEDQVLSRFRDRRAQVRVQCTAPWVGVRQVDLHVPAGAGSEREHRLQLAWRLGPASDLAGRARARLLETVLLDAGGGLLRQAIESLGFGRLSDHSGLDSSTSEIVLHVGMAGLQTEKLDAAHAAIREAMLTIARHPNPRPLLRDGLRQLRHADRRPRPAVQRLIDLAQHAVRGEDVLAALDVDAAQQGLAAAIEQPDFLSAQLDHLLQNTPCLLARVHPDPQLLAQREHASRRWTETFSEGLSVEDRLALAAQAKALATHQQSASPAAHLALLPRIALRDVDPLPRPLPALDGLPWQDRALSLPTMGLSHAWLKLDASALPEVDWPWLALYAELLPQLGAADMDHEAAAHWRRARVTELLANCDAAAVPGHRAQLEYTLRVDALREDQASMPEVLVAWFLSPRLDAARLHYLIGNLIEQRLADLGQQAAFIAALEARAGLSGAARFRHTVAGLPSLDFMAALQAQLRTPQGAQAVSASLARIQTFLQQAPRALLSAGIERDAPTLLAALQQALGTASAIERPPLPPSAAATAFAQPALELALWLPAQVNHCVAVWLMPDMTHPDAPALAVLAELVQTQLLHPRLRERGGAYGAQAHYALSSGFFTMQSSADPRLAATYEDMLSSVTEVQQRSWTATDLEEAILAVIRRLDPLPVGAAQMEVAWTLARQGLSAGLRQALRRGVLGCSLAQVQQAAATHLVPARVRRCASIGWIGQDLAGLNVLDLQQHVAQRGLGVMILSPDQAKSAGSSKASNACSDGLLR